MTCIFHASECPHGHWGSDSHTITAWRVHRGSQAAALEGNLAVIHDQVTVCPGLPGRVLCWVYFINSASLLLLESVLFWKINHLVSKSLIKPGLNSILDLPPAACSLTKEADRHLLPSYHVPQPYTHTLPRLLPTACNCSGHSEECTFDRELFRSSGHGGRCLHCRAHTAGPHCERCQENFYRWSPRTPCQPCDCHPAGE